MGRSELQGLVLATSWIVVTLVSGCAVPDDDPLEGYAWREHEAADGGLVIVAPNPDPDPQAGSEDGGGGRTGGDWVINGLSDPTVSGVKTAYPLDSPQGLGAEGWIAEGDPQGEKVIRYLVECALDEGDSITVTGASGTHVFEGDLGLAPEWKDSPCNATCQQWVSACLLARTNESGADVMIFVQGGHPSLGFGADPEYPNYEGTFFGNVFADSTLMYACRGTASGTQAAIAQGRTCTIDDDHCGFKTFGDCVSEAGCGIDSTGVATHDCQPFAGGPVYQGIAVQVVTP